MQLSVPTPMQMPWDDVDRVGEAMAGLADDDAAERNVLLMSTMSYDDDGDGRVAEAMGGMRRCDDC